MASEQSFKKARHAVSNLPRGFNDLRILWKKKNRWTAEFWNTETMEGFVDVLKKNPDKAFGYLEKNGEKQEKGEVGVED